MTTFSTPGVRFPDRAEHMVLDYSEALNLLKLPVGGKVVYLGVIQMGVVQNF